MEIARLIENRTSSDIVCCTVDTPVREAIGLLARHRIGALPIMAGGSVAGIFSERDVIYCLAEEGEACLARPVSDVMSAPAITIERRGAVLDALALMTERRIRHLPVVDGELMCGFLSIGDLVKWRLEEVEFEAEAMRAYIQTA